MCVRMRICAALERAIFCADEMGKKEMARPSTGDGVGWVGGSLKAEVVQRHGEARGLGKGGGADAMGFEWKGSL